MDALRTFFRRRFRQSEVQILVAVEPVEVPSLPKPVTDITNATVIFLIGYYNRMTELTMFRFGATGDESIQLDSDTSNTSNIEDVQWSVCPASRFNPVAGSDPDNGKFIFLQFPWWNSLECDSTTITKWLTENLRGTPKDAGVIYLDRPPFFAYALPSWLTAFHEACKVANMNIHPLRTVVLSTGWTEGNCRAMYRKECQWIIETKEEIRTNPKYWAKLIRGEPRFARLLNEDAAVATVKLLFAPDSDSSKLSHIPPSL